jgi:hypothetical protein
MRAPRLQSVVHGLAIAAVVCFALQVFSDNKADVDLWGNLGFVRALPGCDDFHVTNTYSNTEPDRPWVNHEWLAQYLFHQTWLLLGNTGLLILKTVLGLIVLALMHATLRHECRSAALRMLLMLLIISTMSYGFGVRPHHFTYLLLAVFLALLKGYRRRAWLHLLVFPLLGMLWANLHGAFFIGAIVLLFHAVFETISSRRHAVQCRGLPLILFGGLALFVAATFVNPFGIRLWGFILESGGTARPYLSEWAPFSPIRHWMIHPDFIGLAVVVCCAYPFSRTRKDLAWTMILYLSLLAAIVLRRNIPLFAIVAGFTAGRHVEGMAGKVIDRLAGRLPRVVWAIVLALFIPFSLYTAATFNKARPLEIEIKSDDYPLRTVAFMKQHGLSGNIFVFFDWAEYCTWHLYPQCRVFMDGRFRSAYSEPVVEDYIAGLYGHEGWERILTAYPTDMALVHYGNPVAGHLARRRDWQLIHSDGPAMLYVKRSIHGDLLKAMRQGKMPNVEPPKPVFP